MRLTGLALAALISGCSIASPIQRADLSKSGFDGAVYGGDTVTVSEAPPGAERYRIFHQGASSFVSTYAIRASAERRAEEFCKKSGKSAKTLSETTSRPPHILGNFPRIEIIFVCV
jgi:hypothetical protein